MGGVLFKSGDFYEVCKPQGLAQERRKAGKKKKDEAGVWWWWEKERIREPPFLYRVAGNILLLITSLAILFRT